MGFSDLGSSASDQILREDVDSLKTTYPTNTSLAPPNVVPSGGCSAPGERRIVGTLSRYLKNALMSVRLHMRSCHSGNPRSDRAAVHTHLVGTAHPFVRAIRTGLYDP